MKMFLQHKDSEMKELKEVLHILTEVLPVELLDLYFTTIVEQVRIMFKAICEIC